MNIGKLTKSTVLVFLKHTAHIPSHYCACSLMNKLRAMNLSMRSSAVAFLSHPVFTQTANAAVSPTFLTNPCKVSSLSSPWFATTTSFIQKQKIFSRTSNHPRKLPTRTVTTTAQLQKKGNHSYDYDLFVLGAGSGGVRASRISAGYGAKVAVAEDMFLGGTCVNVGCVPKKLFVYGSHFVHDVEDAVAYGWDFGKPKLDWKRLIENKNEEIKRLNGIYGKLLTNAGVEIINGRATLDDEHTVRVGDKTYTADKILIAVGGWPMVPDIPGKQYILTSNEMFYLEKLPEKVVIVGGGYIAVEFACILAGYGVDVTQVYRGPLFLRGFDHDVRQFLADEMGKKGINLMFNSDITRIEKNESTGKLTLKLKDGGNLETDQVMYATGRIPKTQDLGLENIGVKMGNKGEVLVNSDSQTNIPNIFCVGDATDRVNLTPVALAEGHCFADTFFGNKPRSVVYDTIPTAVFSQPTIGTCGLTEEEAREKYGKVDIYKTSFRPMKHTLTKRDEKTFMKLIVEPQSDKVVGCHICDPHAGETIQLVGVAMKAGATKADFDSCIGVHPTSAEELVTMRTKQPDPI